MDIELICVGKLKEKYLQQGIQEYLKRLQTYAKVKIIELADAATKEDLSQTELEQILEEEAKRIEAHLKPNRQVIVLAIEGDLISSEDLAQQLEDYATYGQSRVSFIIGGSLGLADRLKRGANRRISFGRITLPHQLMRLVLVEQIYRAFRIMHHHAYHK